MVVRIENSNGSNDSNSSDNFALRVEVGKEGVQGNELRRLEKVYSSRVSTQVG